MKENNVEDISYRLAYKDANRDKADLLYENGVLQTKNNVLITLVWCQLFLLGAVMYFMW